MSLGFFYSAMMIEEEYRIQNTEFRIQNQSIGDSDPPLIVRVASPLGRRPPNPRFGEGARRLFRRSYVALSEAMPQALRCAIRQSYKIPKLNSDD
jgi:hypothetical protein